MTGTTPPPVGKRPRCPGCNDELRPMMHGAPKQWSGYYRAYGSFCTLRCCEVYANRMFLRFGVRYSKVPK